MQQTIFYSSFCKFTGVGITYLSDAIGGKKERRIKLKTIFLQQEKIYLSYQEKRTKKIANLFNNNFNYKALIAFVLNTYKYNVSTKHAVTL